MLFRAKAHNYKSHFAGLKNLKAGDRVVFTEMNGTVSTYAVETVSTVDPSDPDTVLGSGFDLVLYTCTTGGKAGTAVFCRRIPDEDA